MRLKVLIISGFIALSLIISSPVASAEKLATTNPEDLAAAIGHFARARSLLIEAVREFDRGYRISDPSALLDTQNWRTALIDKAQEIEKVLDPQPRVSKSGVKYNADKRLLNEAKE